MPVDVRKAFLDELDGVLDDGKGQPYDTSDAEEMPHSMDEFEEAGGAEVAEQLYTEIEKYINRHD